jgi:hypothetical protein
MSHIQDATWNGVPMIPGVPFELEATYPRSAERLG